MKNLFENLTGELDKVKYLTFFNIFSSYNKNFLAPFLEIKGLHFKQFGESEHFYNIEDINKIEEINSIKILHKALKIR